jgi:putative transposase
MPRTPRVYQQALCYHIFNRGINRRRIFEDDQDRLVLQNLVRRYKDLCGAKLLHWVWMDTHFHLLVEVSFDRLKAFAGGIQQTYAQYHHARHGGCGVFWQGRYGSQPVEIGEYLVRCGRYIERNPVRAKLVECAWDYAWSSARCYVQGLNDGLTNVNPYIAADKMSSADRRRYGAALMSGVDDAWFRNLKRGEVLGSESFAQSLGRQAGRHRLRRGRPKMRE